MPGGRPLKIKLSAKELTAKGDEFFKLCDATNEPYTITGLALAIGFNSRQQLIEYENRDEFHDAIKKLKTRVENFAERQLYFRQGQVGAIFFLKNFGWTDRQELTGAGGKDLFPIPILSTMNVQPHHGNQANSSAPKAH